MTIRHHFTDEIAVEAVAARLVSMARSRGLRCQTHREQCPDCVGSIDARLAIVPAYDGVICRRGSGMLSVRFVLMIWALTSEVSTWAVLILGFGLAVFLVAERVGQMTGASWWDERLQEARKR
jgi:hypothetical protein